MVLTNLSLNYYSKTRDGVLISLEFHINLMILDPHESDEAKEDFEETNSDSEYERKEYEEEFQI